MLENFNYNTATLAALIPAIIRDLTRNTKPESQTTVQITTHNSTPAEFLASLWTFYATSDALVLHANPVIGPDDDAKINLSGVTTHVFPYASISSIKTYRPFTEKEQGQHEEKITRLARTSR